MRLAAGDERRFAGGERVANAVAACYPAIT